VNGAVKIGMNRAITNLHSCEFATSVRLGMQLLMLTKKPV